VILAWAARYDLRGPGRATVVDELHRHRGGGQAVLLPRLLRRLGNEAVVALHGPHPSHDRVNQSSHGRTAWAALGPRAIENQGSPADNLGQQTARC
jgi:hypothetical protein